MHSHQRNIVDDAEVVCGLLSMIVEKASDALDVLVVFSLERELLNAVCVDDTMNAYLLAVGIGDAQANVEADVEVVMRLSHEERREGQDEQVVMSEGGVGMNGEAFGVEQALVAQH